MSDDFVIEPTLDSNNLLRPSTSLIYKKKLPSPIYIKIASELKPPIDGNRWHWHNVLVRIKYLPELILERYQFVPNTQDEKQYIKEKKWSYATLYEWLDILVPGDKPPNSDLLFTNKVQLKLKAESSRDTLNLLIEMFQRKGDVFSKYHDTPAQFLFAWEADILERAMQASGLISGSPTFFNKQDCEGFNKNLDHLISLIEKPKSTNVSAKNFESGAVEFVFGQVAVIAAEDTHFRNGKVFRDFRTSLSKELRDARRNGELSFLEDGSYLPTGRSRPRSAQKKVGFVKIPLQKKK
jgi:hypothetical protein